MIIPGGEIICDIPRSEVLKDNFRIHRLMYGCVMCQDHLLCQSSINSATEIQESVSKVCEFKSSRKFKSHQLETFLMTAKESLKASEIKVTRD